VIQEDSVFSLPEGPFGEDVVVGGRLGVLGELELLPPATPSKIVCIGRNYADHAKEHGAEVPVEPALFLKPPSSLAAHGSAVVVPPQSERVEHEGELALIVGRRCRGVSRERAWEHVLGITCGNDVTARDLQKSDVQWTRAKGFDTFCPLGPWVRSGMSEDEVEDLEISCRVNDVVRQTGRTRQMVYPPAHLISYISSVMTLEPGDVVMTGTPAGVGPLEPGDVVEVEIEGIGVLRNPVQR
jgi:2-keto-4-pentenoate hydratase/2-oxohepta-3-ene-1,7-dioic acid hydratase in catechol pathway